MVSSWRRKQSPWRCISSFSAYRWKVLYCLLLSKACSILKLPTVRVGIAKTFRYRSEPKAFSDWYLFEMRAWIHHSRLSRYHRAIQDFWNWTQEPKWLVMKLLWFMYKFYLINFCIVLHCKSCSQLAIATPSIEKGRVREHKWRKQFPKWAIVWPPELSITA